MKEGDKVIVWKRQWDYEKKGTIAKILLIEDLKPVYRVYFYENGRYVDGCNVFTSHGDLIEIDIEEMREDLLNRLLK
jgi:hypothetical protein